MQKYAQEFYSSKAWKECRAAFTKSKGGLCERCLKAGRYNAGEMVHHKIHITPRNINDPNITLSFDNLELLCRDCHAAAHKTEKRYHIDKLGKVICD